MKAPRWPGGVRGDVGLVVTCILAMGVVAFAIAYSALAPSTGAAPLQSKATGAQCAPDIGVRPARTPRPTPQPAPTGEPVGVLDGR